MVPNVDGVATDFELQPFREGEVLDDGYVPVLAARTPNPVVSEVSESRHLIGTDAGVAGYEVGGLLQVVVLEYRRIEHLPAPVSVLQGGVGIGIHDLSDEVRADAALSWHHVADRIHAVPDTYVHRDAGLRSDDPRKLPAASRQSQEGVTARESRECVNEVDKKDVVTIDARGTVLVDPAQVRVGLVAEVAAILAVGRGIERTRKGVSRVYGQVAELGTQRNLHGVIPGPRIVRGHGNTPVAGIRQ